MALIPPVGFNISIFVLGRQSKEEDVCSSPEIIVDEESSHYLQQEEESKSQQDSDDMGCDYQFYDILGVDVDASLSEIQEAYLRVKSESNSSYSV